MNLFNFGFKTYYFEKKYIEIVVAVKREKKTGNL